MSTCLKTFTVTVADAGLQPYLWWPMEESGAADRVDTVQGLHMANSFLFQGATSRDVGKVAFGMEFTNNANARSSDWWTSETTLALPFTGLEVDFWARWDSWTDLDPYSTSFQFVNLDMLYDGESLQITFTMEYNKTNLHITLSDDAGGFGILDIPFVPVAGTWYFFSLFYDIAGSFGLQINNAAPTTAPITPAPGGTVDVLDTLIIAATGGTSGPPPPVPNLKLRLDEYAIFLKHNNPTNIALLYNGGAGRTWP